MSGLRSKTPAKIFTSDLGQLEKIIIKTIDMITDIVGSSLGPGGRNVIIENELEGLGIGKNTKDGVTIFRSLGSEDPYEHLIIGQTRDCAVKTVNEAGDGSTSATIIAGALVKNIFAFCKNNPKYSPQKVVRRINEVMTKQMVPAIKKASTKITSKNTDLLEKVATVSVNGDKEMAQAVMKAFELTGFGSASHVTIQELSGPSGYDVELIEGFPVAKGYEESIGKFHPSFINDQIHQRCILEKPLFILFDGQITDMIQIHAILEQIGLEWTSGNSEYKNVAIIAHKFGDQVLTQLSFNFNNPLTINVVPLVSPMDQLINSQLNFLMDLSAFTGAKIFDMNNPLSDATPADFGKSMERIEIYRFRTTVVGDPDELNIEARAAEIQGQVEQAESKIEKIILEERLGKLTSGIARLKVFGASNGELKEKSDRAEDAVCSVRAAINHGCLPGGCRVLVNIALDMQESEDTVLTDILIPSLFAPLYKLLDNAGHNDEEVESVLTRMIEDRDIVYDVENCKFGDAKKMGILDATLAVEQALKNAVSIAGVMGTLGGIVAYKRDHQMEQKAAKEDEDYENSMKFNKNEANERW